MIPAVSKKWKTCFDHKPTLISPERVSYYDADDYLVELKFEYEQTSGDDNFKRKILEL
jgi:hypothetical protein